MGQRLVFAGVLVVQTVGTLKISGRLQFQTELITRGDLTVDSFIQALLPEEG